MHHSTVQHDLAPAWTAGGWEGFTPAHMLVATITLWAPLCTAGALCGHATIRLEPHHPPLQSQIASLLDSRGPNP